MAMVLDDASDDGYVGPEGTLSLYRPRLPHFLQPSESPVAWIGAPIYMHEQLSHSHSSLVQANSR